MSGECHDALETRDPAARETALMAALPGQVAHAKVATSAFAESLRDIDAASVTSRSALAALPVVRKHELLERQKAQRASDPFGGCSAIGWGARRGALRVYQSPGPIYEPEGRACDYWRVARGVHGGRLPAGPPPPHNLWPRPPPAGGMMESGAHALACTVFPGGVGNTELQVHAMADLRPNAYVGTPSFLKILLEKALDLGIRAASLQKALFSGEAFPASLQQWLGERGIDAYQCYAPADIGRIAYETAAREGLVLDEGVIVEIVRPGTGDPVLDGEVGELVVTTLNPDYPLIRFGTGDLSALLPGRCPTGRTNRRIRGWMGRADQTAKVRGMFVHPGQVADIVRRHREVIKARLVMDGEVARDRMTLQVEVSERPEGLAERIAGSVREVTKLRSDVLLLPPGSLPNDGKLIEDARSYR